MKVGVLPFYATRICSKSSPKNLSNGINHTALKGVTVSPTTVQSISTMSLLGIPLISSSMHNSQWVSRFTHNLLDNSAQIITGFLGSP